MNCLELFSGTHSVGKVLKEKGHKVISLDLNGADINCDILEWDYTKYPKNSFDYIHASPPCNTFSNMRTCWFGREIKAHKGKIFTKELMLKDQLEIGVPILNKTREIINYFNPKYFTIENPQRGQMKKYITDLSFADVDYCMYGLPYKKTTRIWNNFNFEGKLCNNDCGFMIKKKHTKDVCCDFRLNDRYRIPYTLIEDWISQF